MSDNKNKYFEIVTTTIVSAPNQALAVSATQRKRVPNVKVLASDVQAERITAAEAREFVAEG